MNAVVKTPGQQLKAAREEVGKTLSELAKTTRIGMKQLQGLEADDYSRIPAPMYVRGFIKIYAHELGLRHEPLVEMYDRMQKGEPLQEKTSEPVRPAPIGEHPDGLREAGPVPARRLPPVKLPAVQLPTISFNWDAIRAKIPEFRRGLNPELLRSPRFRIAAAVVAVVFVLLLGIRSCVQRSPSVPETDLPEVEEPLLNQPDPVFFELPRTFQ
jgi:transcriptional regulator with XRE-family HTH domain